MTKTTARRGQPSQYKQSSRKGKTAWRKNIDLTSTEVHLEQMADEVAMCQPNATGGKPLHALADTALFVEDRSGQETVLARRAREKRPLKSLEILNRNAAGAAPFHTRERSTQTNAATPPMSKKMKDRLRRIAGRADQIKSNIYPQKADSLASASRAGSVAASVAGSVAAEQSAAVQLAQNQAYDVWNKGKSKSKSKSKNEYQEWLIIQDQKPTKPPKTLHDDHLLSAARAVPSVSLPHPGMSYNPDIQSHEQLIKHAYAVEKQLEDGEQLDQLARQQWIRNQAEAVQFAEQWASSEKHYKGMEVDMPCSDHQSDESDEQEQEQENQETKRKMPRKKTKAQRLRAKRAAQEVLDAKARREVRAQKQLVAQLPKLRKQFEAAARARIAAAEQRRRAKQERIRMHGLEGKKLGKHRVPHEKIDVQTGEELSESLRGLKPEGNLFRDRYQKMQARALVEPRVPVKTTKRKATKRFETHSYKRFQ